jgi:Flp pilus assembly protein TadD
MHTVRNLAIVGAIAATAIAATMTRSGGKPADPEQVTALVAKADELSAKGQLAKAEEALEQAVAARPEVESLQFRLATQKVARRRYDEAEAIYQKLAESQNPAMAALAQNSLRALDDERQRNQEAMATAVVQVQSSEDRRRQAAREAAFKAKEEDLQRRQEIFDLFAAGRDREAIDRLDTYAETKPVPTELQFAKVFALQRMRRFTDANQALQAMPPQAYTTPDWLLARSANERALGRETAAWEAMTAAAEAAKGTRLEPVIQETIADLPLQANLDRFFWGELQLDMLYTERFDDTIFYGELRQGFFVPGARWLQPFIQLSSTLDTASGEQINGLPQVYANNLAGIHAGVRARLIPNESLWAYGLVGVQKDLRATTRFKGDWFLDWRAGIRGYKGIGPGLYFLSNNWLTKPPVNRWQWTPRLAPFAEGGFDAAYWSLYENFIAYGSLRQGFRFLEAGGWLGFDLYALQQGTIDSEGLYYNNFAEFGGGLRATARLGRRTTMVGRVEYLGGTYFGRDNDNSRGTLPASYDDVRAALSLWWEW